MDINRTSKQRCYMIPVGPDHHIESLLDELLRQHHYTYWVNDVAMETVNGITRPMYPVPPVETNGELEQLRRIDKAARTYVERRTHGNYSKLCDALFDGRPAMEPTGGNV